MSDPVKAYPLQWPTGWRRTEPDVRRRGQFSRGERQYSVQPGGSSYVAYRELSIADATKRVLDQLGLMGVISEQIVISTNLRVGIGGLPLSKQAMPADPGVAVYWLDVASNQRRCMAVDRYDRVEHNLAALAATLEAMRAIERHGGAEVLDRAFTGFAALPRPQFAGRPWRQVLGFDEDEKPSVDLVKKEYRLARGDAHPDRKTGSHEEFLAVQEAYEAAARELGFTP